MIMMMEGNNKHSRHDAEEEGDQSSKWTEEVVDDDESEPSSPRLLGGEEQSSSSLSKNAQRRLKRQEKWTQKKQARKLKRKEEQAAKKQRLIDAGILPLSPMQQEEDPEAVEKRREERRMKRLEERKTFLRNCEEGCRVIIDCGFDNDLTEKELSSLAQQIMYLHASNKKSSSPNFVYLTELGPKLRHLLNKFEGLHDWPEFHLEEKSYLDVFENAKDHLVYLTSDSPDTLDCIDPKAIYIIGGIVDRNRMKGATFLRAQSHGVRTAKFPLQEHVTLTSSPVLTVNHVFDIILELKQNKNDWLSAFLAVLPARKQGGIGVVRQSHDDEQQDEENRIESIIEVGGQARLL